MKNITNKNNNILKFLTISIIFFISNIGISQNTGFEDLFFNANIYNDSFFQSLNEKEIFKLDTNNIDDKYFGKVRVKTIQKSNKYKTADSIEIVHFYTKESGLMYREKDPRLGPTSLNCPNLKIIIYVSNTSKLFQLTTSISEDVRARIKRINPTWKNLYNSNWYFQIDEKKRIQVMKNFSKYGKRKNYLEIQLTVCP